MSNWSSWTAVRTERSRPSNPIHPNHAWCLPTWHWQLAWGGGIKRALKPLKAEKAKCKAEQVVTVVIRAVLVVPCGHVACCLSQNIRSTASDLGQLASPTIHVACLVHSCDCWNAWGSCSLPFYKKRNLKLLGRKGDDVMLRWFKVG